MKKIIYLPALALTALIATSCSSDDMPSADRAHGLTTFTVQLPDDGIGTRFGEGVTAKKLFVAITEAGQQDVLFSNFTNDLKPNGMTVTDFSLSPATDKPTATVTVSLVKDKEYDIYFWAQSYGTTDGESCPYTWDAAKKTITIDYTDGTESSTSMKAYDEARDAFFAKRAGYKSTGAGDNIALSRPFAQVNVGTKDVTEFEKAGGIGGYGIKIAQVGNVLNLGTGKADETSELKDVTVATAEAKGNTTTGEEAFPYQPDTYRYLAMAYVLPGDDTSAKGNVTVSLNADNKAPFATYDQVPVQMNYRTNIYGALLTNPEVFNVEIVPTFTGTHLIARDTDELKQLVETAPDGTTVSLGDDMIMATENLAPANDITIDLNEKTLSVNRLTIGDGNYTKIENGAFTANDKSIAVKFDSSGGTVEIENVEMTSESTPYSFYFPRNSATKEYNNNKVIIKNSTLNTGSIGISIGAGVNNEVTEGNSIELENVTIISTETPLVILQDMEVKLKNCIFKGTWQGALFRSGQINAEDCEFILDSDGDYPSGKTQVYAAENNPYKTGYWGSVNEAAIAALIVGSAGINNYNNWPISAVFNNCKATVTGDNASYYASVFITNSPHQNIDFTYTGGNLFTGAGFLYRDNNPSTTYIKVNGTVLNGTGRYEPAQQ